MTYIIKTKLYQELDTQIYMPIYVRVTELRVETFRDKQKEALFSLIINEVG